MRVDKGAAPAQGQPIDSSPSQVLVVNYGTATVINVSQENRTHLDVRIRDRYVRYVNDPATGIWRTAGDGVRALVSPFALRRITVGRHGVEIELVQPPNGNVWAFEGDLDTVATLLWRAGRPVGCRAERKLVYWALYEFTEAGRRQAAARGGQE